MFHHSKAGDCIGIPVCTLACLDCSINPTSYSIPRLSSRLYVDSRVYVYRQPYGQYWVIQYTCTLCKTSVHARFSQLLYKFFILLCPPQSGMVWVMYGMLCYLPCPRHIWTLYKFSVLCACHISRGRLYNRKDTMRACHTGTL